MEELFESHKYIRNPDSIRNGNLVLKSVVLAGGLLCTLGIYWKKRRKNIRKSGQQYNVMTLNQTVLLVILLNLDSTFFSYLLSAPVSGTLLFNLEMLRTILIENLFFKCLQPLEKSKNCFSTISR